MSKADKAGFEYASNSVISIPGVEAMSDDAVIHNIKFMAHTAGARALLEHARKCYAPDGNPAVLMAKLEAYFEEQSK